MSIEAATVQTLTAEVRVLMVGSRQITLSVFRQLDAVCSTAIRPFGRVKGQPVKHRSYPGYPGYQIDVVGAGRDGELCRSWLWREGFWRGCNVSDPVATIADHCADDVWAEYEDLPLIVLAGLR